MKKKTGFCMTVTLVLIMCVSLLSMADGATAAEKYPSRPVTIVVPFAAGGISGASMQLWKRFMEKYIPGLTIIVEQKPGGGAVVGTTFVANSKPDGYTLLNSSDYFTAILYGTATYKLEDLMPVAQVAKNGTVLVVNADAPWKTFQEFMDYANKNPGVKYCHPGTGTTLFLRASNLNRQAGLKMIPVPMKSDGESIAALLGKHVMVAITSIGTARPQAEAGKLRILMSFDNPKDAGLDPSIPHFSSLFPNIPDLEVPLYIIAPANTPKEITDVIEQALEKATKDPEFINETHKLNQIVSFVPGRVVKERMAKRMEVMREVMKAEGLIK
jgi:tripartite-type tricarboxylate transporter receptor subunit TctC